MNWDSVRRADGSISLVDAAHANYGSPLIAEAYQYMAKAEGFRRIYSRQVAATILALVGCMMEDA